MTAHETSSKKKILFIAANPAVCATAGWPVGFWWAELTHPHVAFAEAGAIPRPQQASAQAPVIGGAS